MTIHSKPTTAAYRAGYDLIDWHPKPPADPQHTDHIPPRQRCARCLGLGGWLTGDGLYKNRCPDCGGTGRAVVEDVK